MMTKRILLAEDEPHLRDGIKLNLEMEGYHVKDVSNGKLAVEEFQKGKFDLILLDVMMPEMDGLAACTAIRLINANVPIMFLTAKGTTPHKIEGLKAGADDYLAKPFDLEELLLRVQNLIKRSKDSETAKSSINGTFSFGGNEINFFTFEIFTHSGEKHLLTKTEVQLLKLLVERKNEVISRDFILQAVWGYKSYPSTRTIDNFILNFRKYFEKNPREPQFFHSIRGVGYKFEMH